MQFLTVDQIRDKFLDFFAEKGHLKLPSYPLVPQGDKSILFIIAGMVPMKPFFTGQEKPPASRVVTCQKCIRTVDIDDVGKDARHGSFFEMLGNFSFGDYFKKDVIPWAWEFLTREMQIPAEKLLISVYEEDDEAFDIWHKDVGIAADKIYRLGKDDNFWEAGVGPCGPCSEIHYDRGEGSGCGKPDCAVGCDCDRFMEIWNLVFIQYEKTEAGDYVPLEKTGIDTGMGLERLATVMQNVENIFEIDNIKGICDRVTALAGLQTLTPEQRVSANIIADHIRSVVFLAVDGVLPSNEGRGYVLRRLLRRAVRHGKALGLSEFVEQLAQTVIDIYSHAYPNLQEKSGHILQVMGTEESRFLETLDIGMQLLQKQIDQLKAAGKTALSGEEAFKLYDTYGFPPDLTREILEDAGLGWDEAGFQTEMEAQKNRARAARGATNYMGADETVYNKLPPNLPTEFVGYTQDTATAQVLALVANGEIAQEAAPGQDVAVVLCATPFYAAGGGQKGDAGTLSQGGTLVDIADTVTVAGNNTIHLGKVTTGTLKVGDTIAAAIDVVRRGKIMRNHSATHLLQKALREVLGDHVEQAGSEVSPDRLRFDFTHFSALTPEEKDRVETLVNDRIWANQPVEVVMTTPEEARKSGATALFGEKYGDTVRMVKMGESSTELCGGTHVASTQEIGMFKLLSESGIASGVRRIEATTGDTALSLFRESAAALEEVADLLRVKQPEVIGKAESLLAEVKELKKAAAQAQAAESGKAQGEIVETLLKNAETAGDFTLITAKLENYDIEALRTLADKLKADMKQGVMMLAAVNADGAVQFLASATDDAVKAGVHAGNLVKAAAALCGGGGGGRPNHAQAGGKDASKAEEALAQAMASMKEMLN
ncbi:MAG: alanine--tRNA ligase [Defluviitaleaceae bacterium]|nr:alanine--tRNA ligase [Defluviitaleaceae bacterium]